MAKQSLIQRELKREQLVAKYKKKYDELKASPTTPRSPTKSAMPRAWRCSNCRAMPTRRASATAASLTGRPRGTFRMFGLARSKIRDLAFKGDIPGVVKASW